MHFFSVHRGRYGAANQCRCNIVKKRREHEHQYQQYKSAPPVVGQVVRHDLRHLALFKMVGEQRESHQQTQQIRKQHPLVPKMPHESCDACAGLKTCEGNFVSCDHDRAYHRDFQRVLMQERNARKHEGKQNEIERYGANGGARGERTTRKKDGQENGKKLAAK